MRATTLFLLHWRDLGRFAPSCWFALVYLLMPHHLTGKTTSIQLSPSRTTPHRASMPRCPPFRWRPRSVLLFTRPSHPPWNDMVFFFFFVSKLGLFCSSTPFVTGRPYTLIFNGSVTSSGAVGIALSAGRHPTLQTAFPGLRAITPPLKVTRCVWVSLSLCHILSFLSPLYAILFFFFFFLTLGRRAILSMS